MKGNLEAVKDTPRKNTVVLPLLLFVEGNKCVSMDITCSCYYILDMVLVEAI